MLSIRTFARSAPRALSRVAGASLRQSAIRPSTIFKSSAVSALRTSSRSAAFSTSVSRRAADGETDDELSAKLESEIQIEEDMKAEEQQPASIKDFLDNSPFELIDTPGQENVKLVRNFGEEKITVSFSIADINSDMDPFNEDSALEDEELNDDLLQNPNRQNNVQSTGGARSAPAEEEMEEDMEEQDEEGALPINLNIVIEKPGKAPGALNIDATCHDGEIMVENMSFYEDAAIARVDTPDAAQKRSNIYPGPPFGTLDEDLQVLVERFLEERGISQAMAVFVPDYVDVKEQREYVRWLNNVKGFIDA